jgi:antirestriction protein ArdC
MKADVYERITGQIVTELEKGVRPWFKPWNKAWDVELMLREINPVITEFERAFPR